MTLVHELLLLSHYCRSSMYFVYSSSRRRSLCTSSSCTSCTAVHVLCALLVHVLFALSRTAGTLYFDLFNRELVVIGQLLTGEDFPANMSRYIIVAQNYFILHKLDKIFQTERLKYSLIQALSTSVLYELFPKLSLLKSKKMWVKNP